jgi:hypothetical protein
MVRAVRERFEIGLLSLQRIRANVSVDEPLVPQHHRLQRPHAARAGGRVMMPNKDSDD